MLRSSVSYAGFFSPMLLSHMHLYTWFPPNAWQLQIRLCPVHIMVFLFILLFKHIWSKHTHAISWDHYLMIQTLHCFLHFVPWIKKKCLCFLFRSSIHYSHVQLQLVSFAHNVMHSTKWFSFYAFFLFLFFVMLTYCNAYYFCFAFYLLYTTFVMHSVWFSLVV